jgi:two-component system phosphate regulon sensor histidine kinase PhoR
MRLPQSASTHDSGEAGRTPPPRVIRAHGLVFPRAMITFVRMRSRNSTSRLKPFVVFLLVIIILPAILYSGYEINSLSTSEAMIADIYRRQLDVVLYSLNQYAWDVASGWATTVGAFAGAGETVDAREHPGISGFVARTPAVRAVVLADSTLSRVTLVPDATDPGRLTPAARAMLGAASDRMERLVRLRRGEYRRLEPLILPGGAAGDSATVLMVALLDRDGAASYAGLILNDTTFIRTVLGPRVNEAAGSEFVLAVTGPERGRPVYTTGAAGDTAMRQERQLWIFPRYSLGIRLAGQSLDEILRSRFERNLVLIVALDLLLLAGAWFLFRAFARELELTRMKSDFVSTVSHELRTPLALIRMYAETLDMGRIKDEAKKKEYLGTIVRETERLSRLVNNILNFARIEAGRKQYRMAQVDLNAAVGSVLSSYEDHLRERGFEPQVALAADLPLIQADEEALSEAIINVMDNAVKYSGDSRYLRVATGRDGTAVFVEVEDRGVGIAPQHHRKIFDTFYRVSDGLMHGTKGSGLGLALVRHIMDAHGGSVGLTSSPGAGSTFRLSFPIERRQEAARR